jgi:hypothetical protein
MIVARHGEINGKRPDIAVLSFDVAMHVRSPPRFAKQGALALLGPFSVQTAARQRAE